MRRISELIGTLSEMMAAHGDLRAITPGSDETGYDDINRIEIKFVRPMMRQIGEYGQHDETKAEDPHAEKCVNINW